MRRQLEYFFCALKFLTRLPIPDLTDFEPDWITRCARYFPLIGQIVGVMCALVLVAAAEVWSGWIPVLLAVGTGMLITGALHEDGLADTADGLGGGATPERRLEIMKDSRTGTYGLLALGVTLALKVAALSSLSPLAAAGALVAAHGLGRAAAVVTMWATPYTPFGAAGKWRPAAEGVTLFEAGLAVALSLWPLALLPGPALVAALVMGTLGAVVVVLAARRLLGGHTGDVLGAVEQVFELGFLLGLAAVPIL